MGSSSEAKLIKGYVRLKQGEWGKKAEQFGTVGACSPDSQSREDKAGETLGL